MDARELEKYIRRDPQMNAVTWGVFARDELPRDDLLPGTYVVNSHDAPGEHWFLIFVEDGMELYDSLGRSPKDYGIYQPCDYLSKRLQSYNSNTCGQYVLYFLYWRSRGIDMYSLFTSLKNDSENIIQEHFQWLQMNIH